MGKRARKASNANIDTSPKITINFLEEVGALQEVVGDAVVCRFLKAANEPVNLYDARGATIPTEGIARGGGKSKIGVWDAR